jgi:hypothetical protein
MSQSTSLRKSPMCTVTILIDGAGLTSVRMEMK